MDRKTLKKKERAKRIAKLRNMVQNNATDQDRIDINPNSYQHLGTNEDGNPIILKKCKSKNNEYYEMLVDGDTFAKVKDARKLKD